MSTRNHVSVEPGPIWVVMARANDSEAWVFGTVTQDGGTSRSACVYLDEAQATTIAGHFTELGLQARVVPSWQLVIDETVRVVQPPRPSGAVGLGAEIFGTFSSDAPHARDIVVFLDDAIAPPTYKARTGVNGYVVGPVCLPGTRKIDTSTDATVVTNGHVRVFETTR